MKKLSNKSTDHYTLSKRQKRVLLTTMLLVIWTLVAIVANQFSPKIKQKALQLNAQISSQNTQYESWMVKGAYATYSGQVNGTSTSVNIDGRIEVTDLNATHVRVETEMTMSTSFAPTIGDKTVQWINKTKVVFQPKGETLAEISDAQLTFAGLGLRNCAVYYYTNDAINATYYLDKTLNWPLRITYTTVFEHQSYRIEMSLKDSKIKELRTNGSNDLFF